MGGAEKVEEGARGCASAEDVSTVRDERPKGCWAEEPITKVFGGRCAQMWVWVWVTTCWARGAAKTCVRCAVLWWVRGEVWSG